MMTRNNLALSAALPAACRNSTDKEMYRDLFGWENMAHTVLENELTGTKEDTGFIMTTKGDFCQKRITRTEN